MESSKTSFHEYALLRAQVTVYVAALLFLFALAGLVLLALSGSSSMNRMGLLLQLIGFLALLPDIIGKEYFRRSPAGAGLTPPSEGQTVGAKPVAVELPEDQPAEADLQGLESQLAANLPEREDLPDAEASTPPASPPVTPPQPPSSSAADTEPPPPYTIPPTGYSAGALPPAAALNQERFDDFHKHGQLLVFGSGLASLLAIAWLLALVLNPPPEILLEDRLARLGLGLLGFAWLNLYLLLHIFRMLGASMPTLMLVAFITVDLPMSLFGVVIAAAAHIAIHWIGRALRFVFRNGVRRVLLAITLPCLVIGLVFELLATFME